MLEFGKVRRSAAGGEAPCVCVIDDDVSARESVVALVRSCGLSVRAFDGAQAFLDAQPAPEASCLVLDVSMPGRCGLWLQEELARRGTKPIPIIFVTGNADIPMSVRAIKAGAREFFTKPFDPEELISAIEACARLSTAGSDRQGDEALAAIVGCSGVLREALRQVATVATTDSTVLVYGETGTGKELVARAIHCASRRHDGPFVKVNCAAIPSGLLESELIGHERGAFTGAVTRRIGRFELAQDGTIFLDEIGEIPIELQPKLLRVLQEREFERLGGTKTIHTNARLVAATNRDLRAMVDDRTFREDLFYRLNVFPIELPPLRERRDDLPLLVEHFVRGLAERMGKDIRAVSTDAMNRIVEHDWPGNVRELQNVLERAVILAQGPVLEVTPILGGAAKSSSPPAPTPVPVSPPPSTDLAAISRAHILGVLEATNWVIGGPDGAAARLGLNRTTLNFRMKKLGIVREKRRG